MLALTLAALLGAGYVNDPLTAPAHPQRTGSRGGTFAADGWTVTGEPDAVWYRIDDALAEARIEFTVSGLEVGTSLDGVDHDIVTVYQEVTDRTEPIPYSPWFRNNDFKLFFRIFGSQEAPPRPGAWKVELASCPRGAPWHHDTPCPPGCGMSGIGYANGAAADVGWDPARAYRIAMWWGNGVMAYSRDGVMLGSISYPGTYAPQPLIVRFGSPRHDGVFPGQAKMPLGIKLKDVVVTGTAGMRTPVCGAAPPDAGTPPADAGITGPGTIELAVLHDVTAAAWEPGVFPDPMDLNVEGPATPQAVAYLRFAPIAGSVRRAVLKLRSHAYPSAAGGSGEVCAAADASWSESTMTWASRPAFGACAGAVTAVDPDAEVSWDITALYLSAAPASLAIVSRDPNGAHFLSKEAGGLARGPRLLVDVVDATAGGSGGGSGGGSAGGPAAGGGSSPAGGAGGGAAGGASASMSATSGCGCSSQSGSFALWLPLIAAALRRARQRR